MFKRFTKIGVIGVGMVGEAVQCYFEKKEGLELFEVVNHLLTGKSYIERGSKAREWILKEVENVRSVQDRFLNELKKI